jgi:hypothetical protein
MYLLDVNALLAMQYQEHVHYARVNAWAARLYAERKQGTAPLMVREESALSDCAVPLRTGYSDSASWQ